MNVIRSDALTLMIPEFRSLTPKLTDKLKTIGGRNGISTSMNVTSMKVSANYGLPSAPFPILGKKRATTPLNLATLKPAILFSVLACSINNLLNIPSLTASSAKLEDGFAAGLLTPYHLLQRTRLKKSSRMLKTPRPSDQMAFR